MKIALPVMAILMVNAIKMNVEGFFTDAVPSHLICFSKKYKDGRIISAVSNVVNVANDSSYNQDPNDEIGSCSATGMWILYQLPNFEGNFDAIYGEDSSFVPSLPGNISSLRQVEHNHKLSSELVLFEKPMFQRSKTCNVLGEKMKPVACPIPLSAIVKGFVDWTIYLEVIDPKGGPAKQVSFCLKANGFGATFFPSIDVDVAATITLIEQGCNGKIIGGEEQIVHKDCGCNMNGVLNGITACYGGQQCTCDAARHYIGLKCEKCAVGFFMKNMVCTDCNCNPSGSDGCDDKGNCKCKDGAFSGKRCNTKTIQFKKFKPNTKKYLWISCHGLCGQVSIHVKLSGNKRGKLRLASGYGWFSCNGQFSKQKKCGGNVKATTFQMHFIKFGSSSTIDITVYASELAEIRF